MDPIGDSDVRARLRGGFWLVPRDGSTVAREEEERDEGGLDWGVERQGRSWFCFVFSFDFIYFTLFLIPLYTHTHTRH